MPLPIPKNSKADQNKEFRERRSGRSLARDLHDLAMREREIIERNRQRREEAELRVRQAWRPTYEDHRRRIVRYPAYIRDEAGAITDRFRIITVSFINTGVQPTLITHGEFRPHNVYPPRSRWNVPNRWREEALHRYREATEAGRIRLGGFLPDVPDWGWNHPIVPHWPDAMRDDAWIPFRVNEDRRLQDGHARLQFLQADSEEQREQMRQALQRWHETHPDHPALQIARGYPHGFIDRDRLQEIIDANEGMIGWLRQDVAGAMNISPEDAGEPETSQMSALREVANRAWGVTEGAEDDER